MVYEFFRDLWDTMEKNRIKAWMYKLLEKYLANSPYPLFLTISEYTKRCLVNLGCDENSVKVVYLGVDHDLFYPGYRQTFRKKYKLDNKFILGWTGRMNLSQSKNLPMLLRAFKIVKEQVPNTVLAFDGPDFRKLEPVVNEMGLKIGKDVFYNGCISRDELPTFYSSIDLYTCSSLSEGFGLSVVEAEACGKPVVCFDAGSLPEVVKDRKTGIVVREKNGRAMADAIITLLTDEGKRKKYGDAAAEWAKTFDWEKTAKETVDIYKELIGKYKR
jgi:glycosyltransferase involved in cell wall biosynthesis